MFFKKKEFYFSEKAYTNIMENLFKTTESITKELYKLIQKSIVFETGKILTQQSRKGYFFNLNNMLMLNNI